MGDVVSFMIDPLREVFALPKHAETNIGRFYGVYIDTLDTFDDNTLSAGSRLIITSRTSRSFPLPAECNAACKEAIDAKRFNDSPVKDGNRHARIGFEYRHPEWEPATIRKADELICSQLGQDALREKWIVALHDFCRVHQREPLPREIASIRAKGLAAQKDFEDMVNSGVDNNQFYPLIRNLTNLRTAMFARLGKVVTGGNYGV